MAWCKSSCLYNQAIVSISTADDNCKHYICACRVVSCHRLPVSRAVSRTSEGSYGYVALISSRITAAWWYFLLSAHSCLNPNGTQQQICIYPVKSLILGSVLLTCCVCYSVSSSGAVATSKATSSKVQAPLSTTDVSKLFVQDPVTSADEEDGDCPVFIDREGNIIKVCGKATSLLAPGGTTLAWYTIMLP